MDTATVEGVQAYGGSYSSVTSYELGVMRFPCNEIACLTASRSRFGTSLVSFPDPPRGGSGNETTPSCVHD